jgi:hypothetical protein
MISSHYQKQSNPLRTVFGSNASIHKAGGIIPYLCRRDATDERNTAPEFWTKPAGIPDIENELLLLTACHWPDRMILEAYAGMAVPNAIIK